MPITITDKQIEDGYVVLTLSDDSKVAVQVDWATKFVQEAVEDEDGNVHYQDTEVSLLEHEIEQAVTLANQRAADSQEAEEAAQTIIDEA